MTNRTKPKKPDDGVVNIKGANVRINGDVVGRDKITTINESRTSGDWKILSEMFLDIKQAIEKRKYDPNLDKSELKSIVEQIEKEVKKGKAANPTKVERWLGFLSEMADDIFSVIIKTLSNPATGIAEAIRLIAKKAKKENEQA